MATKRGDGSRQRDAEMGCGNMTLICGLLAYWSDCNSQILYLYKSVDEEEVIVQFLTLKSNFKICLQKVG